ncbi:MAG: endonuclease III [Gammaproteobacteria bacterium]|nr:endonuclease III [Gammaproteobacteria bacterium]
MNKSKRLEIFKRLAIGIPDPKPELNFSSPFELLIAVILSAQATDRSVNKVTTKLFSQATSPEAILDLGEDRLRDMIKTIGLFNHKASHIISTCRILTEQFTGKVPEDRKALESLPGVGRKTANVILNTAFGQPTIAVDTHVFRVSNRTRIAPGNTVLEVEKRLLRMVPSEYLLNAHHLLILHGRYTCIARKPRCGSCIIKDMCEYTTKTDLES